MTKPAFINVPTPERRKAMKQARAFDQTETATLSLDDLDEILQAVGHDIWGSMKTCAGRPDHSTLGWDW